MCGRYSLAADAELIEGRFNVQLTGLPRIPRYNVTPTQEVLTIAGQSPRRAGMMRWGLVPSWAKDPSAGNRMINARAETLVRRPAFRMALERRRCLVVADGFYEWTSVGNHRVPRRFTLKSGEPFAFAGLWERWKAPSGEDILSCTIITTGPNLVMQPVHDRMPVILSREAESLWLDAGAQDTDTLTRLLVPFPAEEMDAYEVSPLVNSPRNDVPECIARVV